MMRFVKNVLWAIVDYPKEFLVGFLATIAVTILVSIGLYILFTALPFLGAMAIFAFVLGVLAVAIQEW